MSSLENNPNDKEQLPKKHQKEQLEIKPFKVFQGETVLVKRSDGSIENDWMVSETPFPEEEYIKVYKKDPENPENTLTKGILRSDMESMNGSEVDFNQAEDLDSLIKLVEKQGSLSGTSQEYSADILKEIIGKVESGELETTMITRAGGLRDAFENIQSKKVSTPEQNIVETKVDSSQNKIEKRRFAELEIEQKEVLLGTLTTASSKEMMLEGLSYVKDKFDNKLFEVLLDAMNGEQVAIEKISNSLQKEGVKDNIFTPIKMKVMEMIEENQQQEKLKPSNVFENTEKEITSPEIKFLEEEKIRLENKLLELEVEYKKNFHIVSKSELSRYESEISSLDRQVKYLIPDRIEEEKKKLIASQDLEGLGSKEDKKYDMEDFDMDNYLD